ncbi:MAG: hypothetical protein ABI275_09865 [Terrimesophilobacter sp.]
MNISVPRYLIIGLAATFSAYHLVLALVAIDVPRDPGPFVVAMVLYAIATTVSLLPAQLRMPSWMAAFNVAVCIALPLLVTSQLDPTKPIDENSATWYVAAIGTLMVITSTRRRHVFAWIGIGVLVVQSIAWAGPGSIIALGLFGSVVWVGISHAISHSLANTTRRAQQFALAEREAAAWQAAQEAHLFERQFRLRQTSRMALPMLRQIVSSGGDLTEAQRQECAHLEGAIRDEIRGRKLLNDNVRQQVMAARRRGTTVILLDEGGIDELPDAELERILNRLAFVIRDTETDKLIARTVPEGSDTAVTVVGLSQRVAVAAAQGAPGLHGGGPVAEGPDDDDTDDDDEQLDLWLEIPRTVQ